MSVLSMSRDDQWRSTLSVGSCRSHHTNGAKSMSSKRYEFDNASCEESTLLYLPNTLVQRHHRRPSVDLDDRSLQELDETVASVTKMYSSDSALDNGERSPTSVSYDCPARDPLEEKVIRHLTRSMPMELRRVESGSGKSMFSKNSRGSRGSKGSKASRRKRSGKLEKKISQIILMSSASEASESSYATKECTTSACRSAQFILTDLFYEATKTMNDAALPQPPFANGTSWSQLAEDTPAERASKLPDPQGATPSDTLPPRHPDGLADEDPFSSNIPPDSAQRQAKKSNPADKKAQQPEDPFADLDILPAYSAHIDVIKGMENESQLSPGNASDTNEEQATNFTLKRDNTMNAPSECTGTLGFSVEPDDSLLQYSSTNLTSAFSTPDFGEPQANTEQEGPQRTTTTEQSGSSRPVDNWTTFESSPFQDSAFNDDFGFDSFPPFDNDLEGTAVPRVAPNKKSGFSMHEADAAWDPSRMKMPASSPSPYSPASVFNFFSADDDATDVVGADSKSDTLWDSIADRYFQ